jgi:hypothetical protein
MDQQRRTYREHAIDYADDVARLHDEMANVLSQLRVLTSRCRQDFESGRGREHPVSSLRPHPQPLAFRRRS